MRGDLFQQASALAVPLEQDFEILCPRNIKVETPFPAEASWKVPEVDRELTLALRLRDSGSNKGLVTLRVHLNPVILRLLELKRPIIVIDGSPSIRQFAAAMRKTGLPARLVQESAAPQDAIQFRHVETVADTATGKRVITFLTQPFQALVMGQFLKAGEAHYLQAKLISTATGRLFAHSANLSKAEELPATAISLADRLSDSLTAEPVQFLGPLNQSPLRRRPVP
jgi:hypothetical protein